MRLKHLYLVLSIIGAVLPYAAAWPFLQKEGLNFTKIVDFLFVNPISSGFAVDLLITGSVALLFIMVEGLRRRIRHLWIPVVGLFLIGVSFALPFFLYKREALRDKEKAPKAGY